MNVAILHYHLDRGGVTHVLQNHVRALVVGDRDLRTVAILHGGQSEESAAIAIPAGASISPTLHCVPELKYDEYKARGDSEDRAVDPARKVRARADEILSSLKRVFDDLGFDAPKTIIHVHNHSLGKNVALPIALRQLVAEGFGLLLQIHDFAEDHRGPDYRGLIAAVTKEGDAGACLYPQGSQVHYAVLNSRDRTVLQSSGVEPHRLHLIPNPVSLPGKGEASQETRSAEDGHARERLVAELHWPPRCRLLTYPVRGIRRKNLGEALLWAAVNAEQDRVGLTLRPTNPREVPSYERWQNLAKELALGCEFEIGDRAGLSYHEVLAASDAILTTSVAEGFGLVFLEPWFHELTLVGRDLPEITADFVRQGMVFQGMSDRFDVPLSWVGRKAFGDAFLQSFAKACGAYGRGLPDHQELQRAIDSLTAHERVDIGRLPTSLQEQVIRRVAEDDSARADLRSLNPWIGGSGASHTKIQHRIQHNADVVRKSFSLEQCGERLVTAYKAIINAPRGGELRQQIDHTAILDFFLQPSRFFPLRIEE